ncbi:DUF7670 domain-containing protein [Candidatus Magnetobacterium casense]|uniref:DUF7670 domain-containing protein n=1 Tax=Candidatus Magnetobacterium casense TaxID=1455061 RepID=A0ABS6S3L9_9BACT|nr:hypothetical protein [Candidatus Magnetobacterium casensis]MBV6343008.1 hypothetical protein [Candidatus Magnetobacterium casensis]
MKKKVGRFIFWTPRIILLVFALFLVIFSFDVFDGASGAGEIALALFMHNLPSLFLFALLWLSWKHDLVGAVVFLLSGAACVVGLIVSLAASSGGKSNPILIIGSVVFLFIGGLFLLGWKKKN